MMRDVEGVAANETTYTPGGWFAIVGPAATVLLPPSEKKRAGALWASVDDGAGFDDVLDALVAEGLRALPGFVLVAAEGDTTKVVVRGETVASFETTEGAVEVDGSSSSTWAERTLTGVTRMSIELEESTGDSYVITDGLVRVSGIEFPAVDDLDVDDSADDEAADLAAAGMSDDESFLYAVEDGATQADDAGETESEDDDEELFAAGGDPLADPYPDDRADTGSTPDLGLVPDADVDDVDDTDDDDVSDDVEDDLEDDVEDDLDDVEDDDAEDSDGAVGPLGSGERMDVPTDHKPFAPPVPPPGSGMSDLSAAFGSAARVDQAEDQTEADAPSEAPPLEPPELPSRRPGSDASIIPGMAPPPPPPPPVGPPSTPPPSAPTPLWGAPAPAAEDIDEPTPAEETQVAVSDESPDVPAARLDFSSGESLDVDGVVLIGRSPDAGRATNGAEPRLVTVPSPHQEISSTHCEVRPGGPAEDGAVVTDLGSTNGTVVVQPGSGPQELRPGAPVELQPGAVIDLGDGLTVRVSTP